MHNSCRARVLSESEIRGLLTQAKQMRFIEGSLVIGFDFAKVFDLQKLQGENPKAFDNPDPHKTIGQRVSIGLSMLGRDIQPR